MRAILIVFFVMTYNFSVAQVQSCSIGLQVAHNTRSDRQCDSNFCFFDIDDSILTFTIHSTYDIKQHHKMSYGIYKRDKELAIAPYNFILEEKYNQINIATLPSGNYQLRIIGYDAENKKACWTYFNFQKYNHNKYDKSTIEILVPKENILSTIDINTTFVRNYTYSDIIRFIYALQPIANTAEQKTIHSFSEEKDTTYVKRFFYNFWSERNMASPEKAWKNYAALLNEVANKYGTLSKRGFQTDRGRIFLQYGKPDYEIQVNSEEGTRPYEVWQYASVKEGQFTNVIFLFIQASNNITDIRLAHCTAPIDVQNIYWKSILFIDNFDPDKNYRVYEFFTK